MKEGENINILSRFFNKSPTVTKVQMLNENGNFFYSWDGNLYKSDIIRSCIRPKVKAAGKLTAKHIRNNKEDGIVINPEPYMRFLLEAPNPYMSFQRLLEKMTAQLGLNNNAFALIIRDEFGYPVEIYPIPCTLVEGIYDKLGNLYLRFQFKNGKTNTFPYKDIIHVGEDFFENDIFGNSKKDSLAPLMEVITTADQGIVKAIKNGGIIKWLLKFYQPLKPADLKRNTKEFTDNYLNIDSEVGGAAAIDSKLDAQQVQPHEYIPNPALTDRTLARIYALFGTNEKIIQSKFTEDEWISYFESEIEPLAIQLSNEFTKKLFTKRERGFGNKIVFEASSLQYASMSTKLQLVQMVDRGALTPNEWREIFNLAPVRGGDEPIRRLDTATVKGGEEL